MITENLNEMIQEVSSNRVDLSDPDYIYTLPKKKLTYDEVMNDVSNKDSAPTDFTIPQTGVTEQDLEIPDNHYKPESEEALIAYAVDIHKKVQTYSIGAYWEIGRTINSFYQGKYGTKELQKISDETGIGRDTVTKMCKFAKQYSMDQVQTLLTGAFSMSWFQITQNLAVEPEDLILTYQESTDVKQFHNGIMKFKDSRESRGKSKGNTPTIIKTCAEMKTEVTVPIIMDNNPIADHVAIDPVHTPDSDEAKNLEALLAENMKLRTDLEYRERKIALLEERLYESAAQNEPLRNQIQGFEAKVTTIEKELSDIRREKEQYENSHYAFIHKMDKIRTALENNTPAKAILEWMDQGEDE
jgi:hypothetical protein